VGRIGARAAAALLSMIGVLVGGSGVAHADAAGPTDFQSTVVAVTPETPAIDVSIIGYDNFLAIDVEPGTTVEVLGYQSEPFIRVQPDGTVEENERSPSVYLSRSKDGSGTVPDYADASLPPSWRVVASGGSYAWHDHRVHWMSAQPPVATPGTVVQSGNVPMVVNGSAVIVTVETTWLAPPAQWPLGVGAFVGVMLLIGALLTRRLVAWVLLVASLAALGVGYWQYWSLPAVTDPPLLWWLLPAIAAASALAAIVLGQRMIAYALVVLGAIQLGIWAFLRREGAWRAVIPTDAPQELDRAVLTLAAVVAVAAAAGGLLGLFRSTE
jgi:hypothetical protein